MNKILVVLGSTREGRKGDKVASWVMEQAKKITDASFELIDLRNYPMKFYNEPVHPCNLHGKCHDESAESWIAKVKEADGYIMVTPEYNHAPSAVLKNALDYAYEEWNRKPVAFVSYGGLAGGARAVEQLRMIAVELQLAPIQSAVTIPAISTHVENDTFKSNDRFDKTLSKLFEDLLWWTKTLKTGRDATAVAS